MDGNNLSDELDSLDWDTDTSELELHNWIADRHRARDIREREIFFRIWDNDVKMFETEDDDD